MTGRPLFWPTVVAISGLVVLLALGTWQLQRLTWKTDLIAAVKGRVAMKVVPLPGPAEWQAIDIDAWEYRPVTVRGQFDHDREVHVFTQLSSPRGRYSGPGYWVITPLALDGGGTVMVNRGFVPDRFKAADTRQRGQIDGPQVVTGLFRKPDRQGFFVPDNDVAKNLWYHRDIDAMARGAGAAENGTPFAPFIIDAGLDAGETGTPGGLPQAGETRLSFKNDHLQYALTWYALGVCLIGVFAAYVRKTRKDHE